MKTLAVVGLGYVGLPVALLAQEKGWNVLGVDIDTAKVDAINKGESPFEDAALTEALKKYPITASTNPEVISQADVIVIAVPTPVKENHDPDLGPLTSAIESILPHLKAGQVLSVESTINPGVMDSVVVPLLRTRTDIRLETDAGEGDPLYLVHCPERINPGDTKWTIRTIPRVIGGYSTEGVTKGKEFYESILEADVQPMESVTEAEAVKIFENTFRDINIAFVNEMAKSFDRLGVDVVNVIKGASTKPFAFLAHYPGNGVGGHCISVDPYYMIKRAREVGFDHKFLKLAREINDSMPQYTLELMDHGLQKLGLNASDVKIALLGLAYKRDIDDTRESPALTMRKLLEDRKLNIRVFDPHVKELSTVDSLDAALDGVDVVMIATNHTEFQNTLTPEYLTAKGVKLVVDGRNSLDADAIENAGIAYYGVGRSNLMN